MVTELKLNPEGRVSEHFNLHGSTIRTSGLPYQPFIDYHSCDEEMRDCQAFGLIPDILNALAKVHNFTVTYDQQPTGDWGLHAFNATDQAEAKGLLGQLRKREYDVAVSGWIYNEERSEFFDFSPPIGMQRTSIMVNLNSRPHEPLFIINPFHSLSKVGIVVMLLILGGFYMTCKCYLSESGQLDSTSLRIVEYSFWIFFVCMNAYFGGALTMFLSSGPSLPFTSMTEALDQFPKWKMLSVSCKSLVQAVKPTLREVKATINCSN